MKEHTLEKKPYECYPTFGVLLKLKFILDKQGHTHTTLRDVGDKIV